MEDFQREELRLNETSIGFLRETAKWAYFLSIMGFIGIAFIVLMAFFMGSIMGSVGAIGGDTEIGMMGGFITVIYLLIAVLYFFPVLYLFKFASRMKHAVHSNNTDVMTSAFENLKSHYKFMGILTIVMISIYILVILFAILGGAAMAAAM